MHLAVGDLIVRNALDRPADVALIDGTQVVTWRDLKDRACRLANGLHRLGIAPTDRVATVVRNGAAAVEALFGLSLGGFVWVPINYGLSAREIEVLLADSRPDAIILDAEFIPQIKPLLSGRRLTVIVRDAILHSGWVDYDIVLAGSSPDAPQAPGPDDVRTIRYTSGTTAVPKGCVGTHRQILASIDNFFRDVPIPDGPFLQLLPLFSGAGIWMAIAAAYRGLPNVLMPAFDSGEALRLIETHHVAHACGVPTMVRRLCDEFERGSYDLSSLKLFGYTGSPMPESVIRRALNVLPCAFYQGFGGGELGGLVSFLLPDVHRAVAAGTQPAKRLSSAGRIATYAEIVIRDLQSGEAVARSEIGEITVRSPSNFSGYHNRPDETAKTLQGPWVYTGDVGYIDEDGFLFVIDRVKDMVLSGGMNVSSAEVEAVLIEHPAVQSAAVIGVPDDEWGEIVTGVVTTRPGTSVNEADLIKFSRERLAGYKAPKSIKFIDQLPLNSIGKMLKRELRSRFAAPQTETQARVTPLRSATMKWKPNTSTSPRGYLVENENLSTLDITMPIDGVAKITLNRPNKLNAFDVAMVGEIRSVIWRMSFDDRVRVIVITGAGRGFCAGRDVGELQAGRALPLPHYRAYTRSNHDMLNDLEAIEKPVIAAINGVCAGGGVELAASCDFRFASATATFSLPEIFIGVIPASGACSRMIQMIGIENVKDLVMTGRQIDAAEAKSMGFVRRVSEPDKLQDDVLDYARLLMKGAPLAIGIGKHVTNTCQNIDTESGRILERLAQSSLVGSTDSTEGIKSFLEKRPPQFAGR